jgi:quercetin dioxygenase-like cupin family protein
MQVYEWDRVEKEQMNPLFTRQVIHSEKITVARVHLLTGCVVPEHSHHNEQISMLEKGSLKWVLGGVERIMKAGDVLLIPPHVPHSVVAIEDSVVVDLFSPVREDWMRGDDAYLRK